MSVSKLSAISEERSGSSMNPSNNVELVKSAQPSAGDTVGDSFVLAGTSGAENKILMETNVLTDKPSGKCF